MSVGMCGLLSLSWPWPSLLRTKGLAATVMVWPIFSTPGDFASSVFRYCPVSLRANLVAIVTTATSASYLSAWSSNSILPPPLSPSSFPFHFFFALSAAACLLSLLPLSSALELFIFPEPWIYMIGKEFWGGNWGRQGVRLIRGDKRSDHTNYDKIRSKKWKRILWHSLWLTLNYVDLRRKCTRRSQDGWNRTILAPRPDSRPPLSR